ncbi:hypothetical protein [Sphingobacterium sp.]|uniref:hypothetical protein n=1 Tax=Sphingobacterium sp. TaxID=341027 RepID=UPI00289DC3F0|nr:hypothetical protein [Sphingobacterium sp.]
MKDQYKQLLDLFKLKEENDRYGRTWMQSPFSFDNKTAATNAYAAVIISEKSDYEDYSERMDQVKDYSENLWIDIPVSWLKKALDTIPKQSPNCDACNGRKEVGFDFDHRDKQYNILAMCPVCEGSGLKNQYEPLFNGMVYSSYVGAKIGHHIFKGDRLIELIEAAKIMNVDVISLIAQTKQRDQTVFRICDVDVISMPIDKSYYPKDCINLSHFLRGQLKEEGND